MTVAPGIFRQYDIRGVVGRDLLPETARAIGRGYAAVLAERGIRGAVAVGRDNRPSGEALQTSLVAGLTASGVDVVELGVVPTPLLYWALHHEPVVGGIQITGSHNPPEYNGFKLCVGHESLHGDEIQHVLALIQRGGLSPPGRAPSARRRHRAICRRCRSAHRAARTPAARRLRLRERRGLARSWAAVRAPRHRCQLSVLRERWHLPQPPSRSDGRRESDRLDRGRAHAVVPTSGSPSMATPTGSASSMAPAVSYGAITS